MNFNITVVVKNAIFCNIIDISTIIVTVCVKMF